MRLRVFIMSLLVEAQPTASVINLLKLSKCLSSKPFSKLIREVKGYGNRDLSEKELEYVAEFVANIYFPDMTFNQIHLLTQYHK